VTSFSFKLHIRTERPLAIADVRQTVASLDARVAVTEMRTATEMISVATRQPAFRMRLLLGFAGVSVLLAAIGIYGVVSQAVRPRLREVAIRLALGAEPRALVTAMMGRAIAAAVAAVALGGAAAMLLSKTLEALLYGVGSRDAASFAAAGGVLVMVAMVAAFIPARRAARLDAAKILRGD
jgi:putative ABC transport system permease protein